jgi:predicted GNAT family acetyltransferase
MRLLRPAALAEFADRVGPFLLRHEVEHGLMYGVATGARRVADDAYWALVADGGDVVAAALRTDTKLLLSREEQPGAMALIAADAASPRLDALCGVPASVHAVAAATRLRWISAMAQGIHECRAVEYRPNVPGRMRLAEPRDREVVARWAQRLSLEALGEPRSDEDALRSTDAHIAAREMFVWEADGRCVSLAAAVQPTAHGIRINNVYTPPELRGHGYASALVAAVTQHVLDAGRRFAFLHTDLANPTSNGIYARIGYRRVCEFSLLKRAEGRD